MALDWLKTAVGLGKDIAGIALSSRKAPANPALDAFMQEQQERARLRTIGLDPSHPEFRKAVAVSEESDRADFAKAVTDMMRARRKQSARGLVNTRGERFDEGISQLRNRLTSGNRAQDRVQRNFLAAAGTPSYDNAVAPFAQQIRQRLDRQAGMTETGFNIAQNLFDVLGKQRRAEPTRADVAPQYKVWESA